MNGIALLFPEWAVRIFFGVMLDPLPAVLENCFTKVQ